MTRILSLALFCACIIAGLAQGTVSFANIGGGVNAPFSLNGDLISRSSGLVAQLQLADGVNVGESAPFLGNGLFSGGVRTVEGVAGGDSATLQVAVIDVLGSVVTISDQFTITLGGAGVPPSTPAALSGLTATDIRFLSAPILPGGVPEPSTTSLAIAFGIVMVLWRRKRG